MNWKKSQDLEMQFTEGSSTTKINKRYLKGLKLETVQAYLFDESYLAERCIRFGIRQHVQGMSWSRCVMKVRNLKSLAEAATLP